MSTSLILSILLGAATVTQPGHRASGSGSESPASGQQVESADTLSSIHTDLDDLVVVAKKDIIKSDGSGVTYSLEEDPSTKGQSLLEALKKVPMVSVDGQDNIYINGDSNFKIYVNGKEEPMMESNASSIFKAMPADAVSKIEVIIEPGAAYDAEGSAGILNLITERKQRKDGYSGSLTASVSNAEYSAALFGRAKYGRFSADANVIYSSNLSRQENLQNWSVTDFTDPTNHRQDLNRSQDMSYKFINGSLNCSYEHDDNNLLTFGGTIMNIHARINSLSSTTSMFNKDSELVWRFHRNAWGRYEMETATANASYQHNFGRSDHRIVLSYLFNYGHNPILVNSLSENGYNYETDMPYMGNDNINYTREHTFQADYANPFGGDIHRLDAGAKVILRHNSAFGSTSIGMEPDQMIVSEDDKVNLRQDQNIYAAYASYKGVYGNWTAVAGLRYEHTAMGMHFRDGNYPDFTRHLNDVVPNASVTYSFDHSTNLRLAYQTRIRRPGINQLNPYQMDIFQTVVQEGNPDLESERSDRFSLTFSKFGRIIGGNVYFRYKYTGNAIQEVNYNDGTVIHSYSDNIGHVSDYALGGFTNINISPSMTLSLNGRVAYISMKCASPDRSNHGWTGNYGANWSYAGPAGIRFSAYGGQTVHTIRLQGTSSGWYYYGLGISRSFLKDNSLNIAVNASNFLAKYNDYKSHTYTETGYTFSRFKNRSWRVGISATWNFGKLNSHAKQTDMKINNDDISTSDDKKGGGLGI